MSQRIATEPFPGCSAFGAVAGLLALVVGSMFALNLPTFDPSATVLVVANGQIVSKHSELQPATIGKLQLPSDYLDMLGFRFQDTDGIEHLGEQRVSIVAYNAHTIGDSVAIHYAKSNA